MLQIAITTVEIFLLALCIFSDFFLLYISDDYKGYGKLVFNAFLCIAVLIISVLLIFKPSLTRFVALKANDEKSLLPALSAIRTYLCFISLDVALVLLITVAGALFLEDAIYYIMVTAPVVFIIGVVKYIFDIRKIGVDSSDESAK